MGDSLRARVRTALVWRSGSQVLAQVVLWVVTLVVIRLLHPSDYGLMALTQLVTGFLALLGTQGLSSAVVQASTLSREDVRSVFGFLILTNGALAALQALVAPLAADLYNEPRLAHILWALCSIYLLQPLVSLPMALRSRDLDYRRQAYVTFGASVCSALLTLGCAATGFGVWSLVAAQISLVLLQALGFATMRWLVWPSFAIGNRRLLLFGGTVTLNSIIWYLYAQAPIYIGGKLLSTAELGIYATAFYIASLPVARVLPMLNEIGFAAFARIQHDRNEVRRKFLLVARVVAITLFPVYFGLFACADLFVGVVLDAKWAAMSPVLAILAIAMLLYTAYNQIWPAVNALGHARVQTGNALLGLLIMPAAFAAGATYWGGWGLAMAWLLAFPLLFIVCAWRSLGVLAIPLNDYARALLPPLAIGALMAAAVIGLRRLLGLDTSLVSLVLSIAAGGFIYVALALTLVPHRVREVVGLIRG